MSGSSFNSISLAWKLPADDGGMPVSNYIIEKRDIESDKWTLVTARAMDTQYVVTGLQEKHAFYFRIFAENCVGVSKVKEIESPVVVQPPHFAPNKPTDIQVGKLIELIK